MQILHLFLNTDTSRFKSDQSANQKQAHEYHFKLLKFSYHNLIQFAPFNFFFKQ